MGPQPFRPLKTEKELAELGGSDETSNSDGIAKYHVTFLKAGLQ